MHGQQNVGIVNVVFGTYGDYFLPLHPSSSIWLFRLM